MSEPSSISKCQRCDSKLSGQFCSNCGHNQSLKRIDRSFILSEIGSVLNFQKGIFFTIKALLFRPAINIKKFLYEDRKRLVKPVSFIILCSLIYIIAQRSLQFEDGYMSYSELDWESSSIGAIMNWISQNYGLANILMVNFIALWLKVFFRKYDYNFFELLILLYFVIGIQMLIFALFGALESFISLQIADKGSIISIIYISWAIGRFFDKTKKINYLKAFFSYILGLMTLLIIGVLIGVFIDFLF